MTVDGLFPASPRVQYDLAPLTEVICQLRFPPILRIESAPPADFQDRIRDRYPLLERAKDVAAEIPPEMLQALGVARTTPDFVFKTEDQKTTVNLGSEAIALSTTSYQSWDDFLARLQPPLEALVDLYKPSFFQRIGLRYINVIQRSALGLDPNRSWSEFLKKEFLGELAVPEFEENALEVQRKIRLRIPRDVGSAVFLQHGLAKKKNVDEMLYRLDFDFYREAKTEVSDARLTLDKFNTLAGRAFRACITDALNEALRPKLSPLADAG
jgi:uncharacterized protein (TIGR04255 family)